MAEDHPDTRTVVAAFAAHAQLQLTEEEREKLEEYVGDVWDMAAALREVESPGLEGIRGRLPLRAAYSNREPEDGEPAPPRPRVSIADREAGSVGSPDLDRGVVETAAAIRAGTLTPSALTDAVLDRIDRYDGTVRSYITVDRAGAIDAAAALTDELVSKGPRSLLHGIPFGAKDNIPASGMRCTYNSPLARDWQPRRDAEAIRRMRAAGAVLVGKHNLNEFGWSIPSEEDLAPPPRNPWFPAEYSVGSSSGGGAAVSARLAFTALGTDGGGSVRLPAGQHSLFGLKPTHRRVPGRGVSEGSVSEVGVLARSAEDAAAVLSVLLIDPDEAGARDRLRSEPRRMVEQVREIPGGLRIGVPEAYLADVGMEEDVGQAFEQVRTACEELDFDLVEIPRPALDVLHDAVRANFVVIAAEHFFDHEGPAADRSRYGPSAGFYNLPGACLTAADYLQALRVGSIARDAIDVVLGDVDVLLTPTSPVTRSSTARDPKTHRRGGNAAYTAPFNIAGHPGVSFPAGLSNEGIPIGMQFVGRFGCEFDLLQAAGAVTTRLDLPPYPDLERMRADHENL